MDIPVVWWCPLAGLLFFRVNGEPLAVKKTLSCAINSLVGAGKEIIALAILTLLHIHIVITPSSTPTSFNALVS